ncbi:MAG: hypothetical protein M1114_02390 [Candidatus Dependentiae bacterium]|nr:hypothetical protein [Candidatus Dependentiae bacterium]
MKRLLIIALLLPIISSASENAPKDVENYETGISRLVGIIKNPNSSHASNRYHDPIYLAETVNLSNDLNLAEIANFIGTKTLIGKTFVEEALAHPLNKQAQDTLLASRQHAIKTLVDNPALKGEVELLLEQAKEAEQEVIKLMSDYFKGKTCPELAQLEAIKTSQPVMHTIFNYLQTNSVPKTILTAMNILGVVGCTYGAIQVGTAAYQLAQMGIYNTRLIASSLYLGLVTGLSGYTNYKDYSTALEKREKMHALYTLINIAEKIDAVCKLHGIKSQFSIQDIQDTQARAVINKLKNPRYKHKKSYFFLPPMVHTLLYRLYQEDYQLASIFTAIAELDAYNALASKIVASPYSDNKFCFVNFLDAQKSEVQTEKFWNVLVKNPVVNSITETKHILLTGPNKGGKSTSIKAILQNIVLGQSFGVAAAEKFDFTMFDVIHSYLNVSDDLINGLSLFAAELKRAQEIVTMVKSLQKTDRKFFFTLDELFTGTVAEDGEKCAYEFVNKLATFDNIMFIYATHFGKLKEVGLKNTNCTNYKVNAPTKNEFGLLVYPFTLSKGASTVNVAMDLARESGLFD